MEFENFSSVKASIRRSTPVEMRASTCVLRNYCGRRIDEDAIRERRQGQSLQ